MYKARVEMANVVIPRGQRREDYIRFALSSQTVCVLNEKGQFQKNCPVVMNMCGISGGTMKSLEFPDFDTQLGSLVATLNVDDHDVPLVIGVLKRNDSNMQLDEEYSFLISDTTEEGKYVVEGKALGGLINLLANGNGANGGRINLRAFNKVRTGTIDLSSDYYFTSSRKVESFVAEHYQIMVRDLSVQEEFTKFMIKLKEGLIYEDEFSNKVYFRSGQLVFQNSSGKTLNIKDDLLNLGSENAKEKAALGETLKTKLESLIGEVNSIIDSIVKITVPTALGPSGIPINSPSFLATKVKLETLSKGLNEILSNVVKLD